MDGSKVCPNCGRQNLAEAQWCAGCGSNISSVAASQAEGSWQQGSYGQPQEQSSMSYSPQGAFGQARQQITSAIQMRSQTDEVLPIYWILLPILGIVLSVVLTVFLGWFIGLGVGMIVFGALLAVLVYKLINRQNEHIKRETVLRGALMTLIRDKAREQYKEQVISGQVATMESINQEASYKEQENNAVLFTIMAFIPLLQFYVLYVLTKHPYEHDQRWHAFTQQVQYAGGQLGLNIMTPSWKTLPRRSFILFFIISIIFTPFMLYWLYVLIDDPNEHYKAQWQFEDQLMVQLR
ncbi:MAG: zinc ribbon domain-containing protein [Euryarchaeota archaeon]|nr:zinc ribbon domain-containing protein [Euryarchaeota archaeon]